MLRRTVVALLAVASLGILTMDTASARGGFGGGGFRGAAFSGGGFRSAAIGAGGFRSAGFRGGYYRPGFGYRPGYGRFHRGFPFAAAAIGVGVGYGLYGGGPYGYYDYGDPYYGYYDDDGGYGGCYVARQRILTSYGWRVRPVQVCD